MFVVPRQAGEKFTQIATNSMGGLLMATPALTDGVMYLRTAEASSQSESADFKYAKITGARGCRANGAT